MTTQPANKRTLSSVDYWVDRPPWMVRPEELESDLFHNPAASNIKKIITWIGYGWAAWAMAGGVYFLVSARSMTEKNHWSVFGNGVTNGYTTVGIALLICGVISVVGMCNERMNRIAALCCAGWCLTVAVVLQLTTLRFDQGDIDAWLLLICAFSCVMRWALLVLEPYVVDK